MQVLAAALALAAAAPPAVRCEALSRAAPGALPLVFLYEGYGAAAEGDADARAFAAALATKAPFDAEPVALYALRGTPAGTCRREVKNSLNPHLSCAPDASGYSGTCRLPRFKLVVLARVSFVSHAAVALPGVPSPVFVSTDGPRDAWTHDAVHELGHAFALRDERASIVARVGSPASEPGPNCAPDAARARARWGDLAASGDAGYFAGCAGHKDWLRPNDATLMGLPRQADAWAAGYGAASVRYLRAALRCCYGGDVERCRAAPELAECAAR